MALHSRVVVVVTAHVGDDHEAVRIAVAEPFLQAYGGDLFDRAEAARLEREEDQGQCITGCK